MLVYIEFITGTNTDCSKTYMIYAFDVEAYSLKELYEKFNKYNFESPHKSFIINMLHIKRIKGFDILMENGGTIPLAQKRAVGFKAKFNDFLQSTFDKI